jgi:DNA repair protein RecO (recombination protein O)
MKPHSTDAIILHTFPARERDKLVVFLTAEHGKRKGWAYGARGGRTRFGASLEPLAKVRIGFLEKESDEIVRIESVDLIRSLFPAQQNLLASVAASYIAETVDVFAQANDPSELVYRLLDKTTEALLDGAPPLAVVAYAEIWMLRLGGVLPTPKHCIECHQPLERPLRFDGRGQGFVCQWCAPGAAEIVANDVAAALDDVLKLPVADFNSSETTLFELRALASSVRRHFLGHELKSFDVLASVLARR